MSFSNAARRMQDSLFERGGDDALWKVGGSGDGVPCKLLISEPDVIQKFGEENIVLRTVTLKVRKSEIEAPAGGDVVAVTASGTNYTLVADAEPTLDAHRYVWSCEAQ
jgi:hypothetical protein